MDGQFTEEQLKRYPLAGISEEYLNQFAQKMMHLSNRLNCIEDDAEFADDLDIKEDYLMVIREFIAKTTGM